MNHLLSDEQIAQILENPKVQEARTRLANGHQLSFTVDLSEPVQDRLKESWGMSIPSDVPMRWIRGDTPAHVDSGRAAFYKTHLAYLTDSEGEFIIGDVSHSITKGTGFTFNHGVQHETRGTGSEPRLLIGPMSEMGFVVGGYSLYYYPSLGDAINYSNQLGNLSVNVPNPFIVGQISSGTNGGYTRWMIAYNSTGSASQMLTYNNGDSLPNDGVYYMYPATSGVPCFAAGTHILTETGYKVVESLTTDDKVQTADGRLVRPMLFNIPIAKTTTDTAPYRIEAGAFGSNYPRYPLSP
jgi:hypothetical protein